MKKRNVEHFYERSPNVTVTFSVKKERFTVYVTTILNVSDCLFLTLNDRFSKSGNVMTCNRVIEIKFLTIKHVLNIRGNVDGCGNASVRKTNDLVYLVQIFRS